jgi:beta-galactosidase
VNQKGLLTREMQKKEAYYVFQSYWAEVPMVHIYGHTWPIRWGAEGEQKMVKIYSNCETAELFLNGKSLGAKKRNSQDFPAAGLRWMTPFVTGKNTLRVIATNNGKTVGDEISFVYQTKTWGAPAELKIAEKSRSTVDGKPMVTIEAKLYDANGVLCLDAKNRVRFTFAGEVSLIDNRGTATGSRVVELYNGRAEISLLTNNGSAVVGVAAEKLRPAFVTIA